MKTFSLQRRIFGGVFVVFVVSEENSHCLFRKPFVISELVLDLNGILLPAEGIRIA
jgi:hypothetical protein